MSYPNCYFCKFVKIKMPYGELKCTQKGGQHHCERVVDSDTGADFIGGKVLQGGTLIECSDYRFRKGEIESEKSLEEEYEAMYEAKFGGDQE